MSARLEVLAHDLEEIVASLCQFSAAFRETDLHETALDAGAMQRIDHARARLVGMLLPTGQLPSAVVGDLRQIVADRLDEVGTRVVRPLAVHTTPYPVQLHSSDHTGY